MMSIIINYKPKQYSCDNWALLEGVWKFWHYEALRLERSKKGAWCISEDENLWTASDTQRNSQCISKLVLFQGSLSLKYVTSGKISPLSSTKLMLSNARLDMQKFFAFPVPNQYMILTCKIQSGIRTCFKLEEVIQLPPRASYSKEFSPVAALSEPVCVGLPLPTSPSSVCVSHNPHQTKLLLPQFSESVMSSNHAEKQSCG